MADRDRDDAGRPQNARPRDALGRPLPHGSRGVAPIPEDLTLTPVESLRYAQDLLVQGLAFNAHEVLEAAWKTGPDDEKPMWQGLAQLAVGITHTQRGNINGAIALLRRAAEHLSRVEGSPPHSVDVRGLIAHATTLGRDLGQGLHPTAEQLRPALIRPER